MRTAILLGVLLVLSLEVHSAPDEPGGTNCRRKACTFDTWLFWWAYNRDDLLVPNPDRRTPDRRDLQVLHRLRKDVNYRASVEAIDEVLTVL